MLEKEIKEILKNFKSGDYFDSHTIINELISNKIFYYAYLNAYPKKMPIKTFHSQIAKEIKKMDQLVIECKNKKIKTHTIFNNINKNQLWKKK